MSNAVLFCLTGVALILLALPELAAFGYAKVTAAVALALGFVVALVAVLR